LIGLKDRGILPRWEPHFNQLSTKNCIPPKKAISYH